MCKSMLAVICVSFVVSTLSGCLGLTVAIPAECKNETPTTHAHRYLWYQYLPASNKADFLKDWGKPDEIISISNNEETWIYKRILWCGLMPFLIAPVPLLLPVCNGFDRIEFLNNDAKLLHTKRIVLRGGLIHVNRFDPIPWGALMDQWWGLNDDDWWWLSETTDPVCAHPIPIGKGVAPESEKGAGCF